MLQSLTTLLFIAVALAAMGLMSALIAQDWQAVRAALGLEALSTRTSLRRRTRIVALHQVPVLRVTLAELQRAA